MPALGSYETHLRSLETRDGRTKESRMLKSFRHEFAASLGHPPSPVERALVESLASLQLRICRLNSGLGDGRFSATDLDAITAATARFARIAEKLGLVGGKQPTEPTPTLGDYLSARYGDKAPPA